MNLTLRPRYFQKNSSSYSLNRRLSRFQNRFKCRGKDRIILSVVGIEQPLVQLDILTSVSAAYCPEVSDVAVFRWKVLLRSSQHKICIRQTEVRDFSKMSLLPTLLQGAASRNAVTFEVLNS
jgi:hypothetical protein